MKISQWIEGQVLGLNLDGEMVKISYSIKQQKNILLEEVETYFTEEEYGKSWVYTFVNEIEITQHKRAKRAPQRFDL